MYNEQLKEAFIESRKEVNKSFFEVFEKFEKKEGVDLCQLSTASAKEGLSEYAGFRSSNGDNYSSHLKQYCIFCENEGLDINRELLSVGGLDLTPGARKYLVSSPKQLYETMNESFWAPEHQTLDCLYRCFLWCAFSGVPYEDIKKVATARRDALDIDKRTIVINDITYELYEESIEDFKNLKYMEEYKIIHPSYAKVVWKQRVFSMFLFRGQDNARSNKTGYASTNTLLSAIKLKQNKSNTKKVLRYKNVYISGIFYRAYQAEQCGLEPDFSKYFWRDSEQRALAPLKPGQKPDKSRKRLLQSYRFMRRDYETWKNAFNLT